MQSAQTLDIPADEPLDAEPTVSRTPQVRHTLVRKLADLVVLSQARLTNNERDFIADILIRSLESVDIFIRQEIAERIAGFAEMPVQLQRYLVRDEIAVAGCLLEKVPHIQESLLLEASQLGLEYRQIIARRDDLTQAVVDVLISFGEPEVIKEILKQDDFVISCTGMDALVRRCENNEELALPLLRRSEIRLDHGLSMFWWVKTPLRKAILARFATDRSTIQEAMHSLFVEIFTSDDPDLQVKAVLTLIDRRHRPRGRNGEAVTMDIVEKTLRLAHRNPNEEFCHAVGLLAGVSSVTAGRALKDFSGEAFAILCKSIGISRTAFAALFDEDEEDRDAVKYSEEKLEDLVGVFDSIARDYSRTILRYWDWRHDIMEEREAKKNDPVQGTDSNPNDYLGAV